MSRRHKNQEPIKSPSLKFHQAGAGFQGDGIILACLSLSGKTLTTVPGWTIIGKISSNLPSQIHKREKREEKILDALSGFTVSGVGCSNNSGISVKQGVNSGC